MTMNDEDTIRLIGSQQKEIEALRQWKSEALLLLTQYDDIAESVGCPLGASKVDNLAAAVKRLLGVREEHNDKARRANFHACGCDYCAAITTTE